MNILITGSASGLGYNAGINLAREGYHVFLTTENDKQLEVLNDKVKNMDNIETEYEHKFSSKGIKINKFIAKKVK